MILVDIGISYKRLKEKASDNRIDLNKIDAIFITHEHSDHIKGMRVFLNNHPDTLVIASQGTIAAIDFEITNLMIVKQDDEFKLAEIDLKTIALSHDVNEPLGLILSKENNNHVHITDTGYLNQELLNQLKGACSYLLESNYEDEMIMENKRYPFLTKKRIMSNEGHLSNQQCSNYLKELISPNTRQVLLGHLSENNNQSELVKQANTHLEQHVSITVLDASDTVVVKDVW